MYPCLVIKQHASKIYILAYIPIRKTVLDHCQTNKNTCSSEGIHEQFEQGFKIEILKMSPELFA